MGWIIFLIILNLLFLLFKCFARTISIVTADDPHDKDIFDTAHEYRFFLFSTIDILNGLSILYCFHCMAECNQHRRRFHS